MSPPRRRTAVGWIIMVFQQAADESVPITCGNQFAPLRDGFMTNACDNPVKKRLKPFRLCNDMRVIPKQKTNPRCDGAERLTDGASFMACHNTFGICIAPILLLSASINTGCAGSRRVSTAASPDSKWRWLGCSMPGSGREGIRDDVLTFQINDLRPLRSAACKICVLAVPVAPRRMTSFSWRGIESSCSRTCLR